MAFHWTFFIDIEHTLNKITLPQQKSSILCPRQHFPIRMDKIPNNIWKLHLTEFSNLSLKLKPCECLCNFPELNMCEPRRSKDVFTVIWETNMINFLWKGFGFENYDFLFPVPEGNSIIWVRSNCREGLSVVLNKTSKKSLLWL